MLQTLRTSLLENESRLSSIYDVDMNSVNVRRESQKCHLYT